MELSNILDSRAVRVLGQAGSKKRMLQNLAEIAAATYPVSSSEVFDALQERESLGPTGVGQGLAIPHARVDGLDHVVGAFVRLEKAVPFDAVDGQPVDLFFALFAPLESGVDHLKALALVSRTLRDPGICAKLRANSNPETLHTILTEIRASRAA